MKPHDPSVFDPTLPLEQANTIPKNWYTSAEIAERELATVFTHSWQCVGRVEQVERPGQYVTTKVGNEPILVVRGTDGILRGFFNVCRHRAAPLLTEPQGDCGTKLRCYYHGWTYDLEGQLRGTPEFDGVADFDKNQYGLPRVRVETWGPFVWLTLADDAMPLAQYLSPLPETVDFGQLQFHQRTRYELACNWKLYVDNYLDGGYHVNTVHPALAGAIDYQEYRTILHSRCNVQTSPLVPSSGNVGATRTGVAAYWWVFPNFMINLYGGVMDTNWVNPLGPDRCEVVFDFYFGPEHDPQFREQSIAVAEQVQVEDVRICEQVQQGLFSRSYQNGRFSVKREAGGYQFHQLLANELGLNREV